MNKLLKTLSMALLCIALSLCVSCKKQNGNTQTTATVTTNDVTEITAHSAVCGGEVTSENGWAVTQRGVCWGTNPNPTLSDSYTTDGDGIGKFISTLTGLTADKKYFVRAYAKNAAGTSFGPEKSFTTPSMATATITTNDVTEIACVSALCGGEVSSENGWAVTQRGVCWSTNPNPTLSDSYTIDGEGIGQFTSTLSGLTADTKYFVRAYAKNAAGTSFGQEKSFTTLSIGGTDLSFAVNGVSFIMKYVESGTFWMGAQSTDPSGQNYNWEAYDRESPVHQVTLSDFYMGETEVTQALWQAVMGSNPSYFTGDDQRPVEQVSWDDCQTFITKLNNLLSSQLNGKQFRLPTEAEWEYAARGGNQSQGYNYSGSNTIGDVAWDHYNSSSTTHPVAQKQANELGLYDMSGNVWEWCQDWYDDYSSGAQTNPTGPSSGSGRVYRGGSWSGSAGNCRVSRRTYYDPSGAFSGLGLRLSLR